MEIFYILMEISYFFMFFRCKNTFENHPRKYLLSFIQNRPFVRVENKIKKQKTFTDKMSKKVANLHTMCYNGVFLIFIPIRRAFE